MKKTDNKKKLKIEYIDIDLLKEWENNPRKNDETVESIVRSIEKFGYTNPILVRRKDNRIIAGHTRVKALRELGEKKAPVIFLDMDKTDADLYALFDNKSTENTPWDIPKLTDLFADLQEMQADLELSGFSTHEIAAVKAGTTNPEGDSEGVMVFQVTENQRQKITAALEKLPGETRTEKLMALLLKAGDKRPKPVKKPPKL